jgi:hypothetical protein
MPISTLGIIEKPSTSGDELRWFYNVVLELLKIEDLFLLII